MTDLQKGNRDEGNSLKIILMSTGKFKIDKLTVSSLYELS